MPSRQWGSDAGFTLIEVLATVVILSLFVVTLLTLMGQMLFQMKLSDQRQQALVLARAELSQMAVEGATAVVNGPRPQPQTVNGVTYTITPTFPSTVPGWALEMVNSKERVYAEVKVTWNTVSGGQSQLQSVVLDQVFPN